ncbi:unnamed protein product [Toxocara canis]|uniref:Sushi, von Willebrand factor type A, EGF and pentraxin domain-containing protein 1 n=1 Tax=Toxocara canis TaxID=6265 RepID=A0A183UWE5_TOXCA|nr:unnamed protein product [Toxocara canis]
MDPPPSVTQKPYEFQHSGKMFAFMSKPYVFKCKAGFAYRAGTIWAQKGRQALQCSDTTHTYSDLDTGAVDAQLESCEELKGCHMINQREDMTVVLEGCVTSGEVYTAGCRVKIMCPTTPQQYPSNANYLKEGYQQLTCRGDGSGWVDQFGISIRTAMSCTIGCIPRPTPNFANRSSNAWNLSVRINGVQLTCVAGSSSATVEKVVEEADDHDFYCKPSSQSQSHNDQMTLEDTCTNACFAIEEIPDSVTVEQKPWRLFDFKGKANFIVPFNGIYVFKCKYPNTYFMNAGQATTQRRLQCDGATSTYKDMATGEMNVKLTPCTEINGAVNLQTTNEHRLPTRTPPLIADNLQTVNHYTILPLTPPSMVNDNMYVGGSWIWQAAARREGNAFIRCSLPELNDDDTMTVFRDERCVNSKTEMVGCSIRIDCEQGYKLRGTSNTSTATVQIKCQPNGTWLDEGSNTTINNVNDLGCVPGSCLNWFSPVSDITNRSHIITVTLCILPVSHIRNLELCVPLRRWLSMYHTSWLSNARFKLDNLAFEYGGYELCTTISFVDFEGFAISMGNISMNRVNVFCQPNGRWRLKNSNIIIDNANMLQCKPRKPHEPSMCKGEKLKSDQTRTIRRRRRCTEQNWQPQQCQVDIVCFKGLQIKWEKQSWTKVSAICERDGRWRIKNSDLFLDDLNDLSCKQAEEGYDRLNLANRRCALIRLKNKDKAIVRRSTSCAPSVIAGCKYSIECVDGYVLDANNKRVKRLVVVCQEDGKWREQMSHVVIEKFDQLECKPGLMISKSRPSTSGASMVCRENGEWKDKYSSLTVDDIDLLTCYVMNETKRAHARVVCDSNGTKCHDTLTGTVIDSVNILRCIPAEVKSTVHEWIECDGVKLSDNERQKIKRRRRCSGSDHESSGCQYDIICSNGFVLSPNGMRAVRMSIVCDSSGKWKEKHSNMVLTELSKLNCVPVDSDHTVPRKQTMNATDVLPIYNVRNECASYSNKSKNECHPLEPYACHDDFTCAKAKEDTAAEECEPVTLRSDERRLVRKRRRCTGKDFQPVGCQYDIKCNHGECVMVSSCICTLTIQTLEREQENTLQANLERFSLTSHLNWLVLGWMLNMNDVSTNRVRIVCHRDGEWREKSSKTLIDNINAIDCIKSRFFVNIIKQQASSAVIVCNSDGKWMEKKWKIPIEDINRVDCVPRTFSESLCLYSYNFEGLVVNVDGTKANWMSMVCQQNGYWKDQHSKRIIENVQALDCVPGMRFGFCLFRVSAFYVPS